MTYEAPASPGTASAVAQLVREGSVTAAAVTDMALSAIARANPALNAFTAITADRARAQAISVDAMIAAGADPGPLAGVPFAVKNLFDVEGMTTIAGSTIHAGHEPARRDATAVARLAAAGAVLVGALNMDEYAYGFTTENSHYGATRNPHALDRSAGGSSGGSGAAVAAGLVPLALGTDTNGSIRVPAAFCGVFGMKPTYGRISRAGTVLFAPSLDHVGPLTRSARDLALAFDVLNGPDPRDPVCADRPREDVTPELDKDIDGLRIAVAGDYFTKHGTAPAFAAVEAAAAALNVQRTVVLPEVARARAAAFVITACEGGTHHLRDLTERPFDFDRVGMERLLSGALLPAAWYVQAQRFRAWFREQVRKLFETVDVLLAPATPCEATTLGQDTMTLDDVSMPVRPNLGVFTQPLSFIGLPVVCAPVRLPYHLPLGVQIVAAPFREDRALRVAAALERLGIVAASAAVFPS